jgi:hypothetical protein
MVLKLAQRNRTRSRDGTNDWRSNHGKATLAVLPELLDMAVGRALPKARERVLLLTDSQVRQLRLSEMGRSETLTSRPSRPLGASGGIVSPLRRITLARCVAFH